MSFSTCGDCYCVPDASSSSCPYDNETRKYYFPWSESDYDEANIAVFNKTLENLKSMEWTNPVALDCDPYYDVGCEMQPVLVDGGACVVDFAYNETASSSSCPDGWKYSLRTYAGTFDEALSEGQYVTHRGSCGACSNLQDLATYLQWGPELRTMSSECGFEGISGMDAGVGCFEKLGFTTTCAKVWYYNTNKTNADCIHLCASFVVNNKPPNGDPPNCTLDPCLQCDEDESGPVFQRYAGRTRRNTGLLSDIVRPCGDEGTTPLLPYRYQRDPCEPMLPTQSPTLAPTILPTQSPKSAGVAHHDVVFYQWILPLMILIMISLISAA